ATSKPGTRHALAHSLGAAAALKAARQYAEGHDNARLFASITLMEPLGLVGNQSFARLVDKMIRNVSANQDGARRDGNYDEISCAQRAGALLIARQPLLAFGEALAAGTYTMKEDATAVMGTGTPLAIVAAYNDIMFPAQELQWSHVPAGVLCLELIDSEAPHDSFWRYPGCTASLVRQLIDAAAQNNIPENQGRARVGSARRPATCRQLSPQLSVAYKAKTRRKIKMLKKTKAPFLV